MRKIYYLVFVMLYSIPGHAANCVTTTQVKANYKTQQVTFKLTWIGCNGTTHLNKAWCFVDFQPVDAAGNKGAWQRATISGTPLVTNGTYAAGNATGFWVTGTNGQSATVTVKLDNASGRFNWCAFATDYPPNAVSYDNGTYTFRGTRPFYINGSATPFNSKIYSGGTVNTITDATRCPGWIERDVFTSIATSCKPGLTLLNQYCRDLVADTAMVLVCSASSYEIKTKAAERLGYWTAYKCPRGWRLPTNDELNCMYTNRTALNLANNDYYWGSQQTGWTNPVNDAMGCHWPQSGECTSSAAHILLQIGCPAGFCTCAGYSRYSGYLSLYCDAINSYHRCIRD